MVEREEYEAQANAVPQQSARCECGEAFHLLRAQLHDHVKRLVEVRALWPPRRLRLLHQSERTRVAWNQERPSKNTY